MIISISNDVLSDPVDSNAGEAVKLSLTAAILTELFYENTVGIEHLRKKGPLGPLSLKKIVRIFRFCF